MNIKNISKNKRAKQVFVLYISTILGVLLGVIASVINTKFLDPVNYGDVRFVQNIISLFSCFFLLGFFVSGSRLLAISKNIEEARGIKGVMVVFLIVTIVALMIVMVGCYFYFSNFSNNVDAVLFLISIPICAQPLMLNYINTTAQGDNQIGRMAIARVVPQLLYVVVAFLVYSSFGASSILMILLQWGIYCIIYSIVIISTKPSLLNFNTNKIKLLVENKKYGVHLYLGSLAMVATQYLSGLTLGIFNDNNRDVAFFTLALTISMPLSMLPSIVGTSYFKQFAIKNAIDPKVIKTTIGITSLSIIAYILLIQHVVEFLYPESYSSVGIFASVLAFGKAIHGIGDMYNRFLGAHGKGVEIRNASFATGFVLIAGSTLGVYIFGIWGAVITNILSSSVYCVILLYYYFRFVKYNS